MQRKYEVNLLQGGQTLNDLPNLVERLLNFQQRLSVKPSEESNKFIFTRAVKFLKKVFKTKNGLPRNFTNVDGLFYSYYFGGVASALSKEIRNFVYPPLQSNKDGFYRCLNLNYIHQLFRCSKFMADVSKYLQDDLRAEYDVEVERKTLKLLAKWDHRFKSHSDACCDQNNQAMKTIRAYFLRNKRCKLPWTQAEVNHAIFRLRNFVDKIVNSYEICQVP